MNKFLQQMNSERPILIEQHAAAQSWKNAWTRLASTYGCIRITLYPKTLNIRPQWFARWMIGLLCLDLSHDIPTSKIKAIRMVGFWLGYGKVVLSFQTLEGRDRKILLYMKKHREFVDAMTRVKNR